MARAMRPNSYRPVELIGRYHVDESLHSVVQPGSVEIRMQVGTPTVIAVSEVFEVRTKITAVATVTRNGGAVPNPQLPGSRYLAVAANDPDVAEALTIMGKAEPNWVDLYKVYEIIRDNIRPAKIEDNGWATKQDQSMFTGSANRQDVSGSDARHARTSGPPPTRTMSLHDARGFIGDLVVHWIGAFTP